MINLISHEFFLKTILMPFRKTFLSIQFIQICATYQEHFFLKFKKIQYSKKMKKIVHLCKPNKDQCNSNKLELTYLSESVLLSNNTST